jgi:hypothetical protein
MPQQARASTNIFLKIIAETLFKLDLPRERAPRVYKFIAGTATFS